MNQRTYLLQMSKKYIWWQDAEVSMQFPNYIIARVMNMGTWEDICALVKFFSYDRLREVLTTAEAGQFNARSWHYWHYKLMDCVLGDIPPMPQRQLPAPLEQK